MASRTDTDDGKVAGTRAVAALAGKIKEYPTDLVLLNVALVVAAASALALPTGSILRAILAVPLVVFLPGYAVVSMLFPEAPSSDGKGLGTIARIGLAFAVSLAVVPLVIVILGAVASLTMAHILEAILLVTIATAMLAAVRRVRLPASRQYQLNIRGQFARLSDRYSDRHSYMSKIGVSILAVGILAATGTAAVAVADPPAANEFTNFQLSTEDDDDLRNAGYERNFTQGETSTLVTVVDNNEGIEQQYTVVAQLHRVEDGSVVERTELTRFTNTTASGERWRHTHEITPTTTGSDLRLTYLLYEDEPPVQPTRDNAYRNLHVWIDVESA